MDTVQDERILINAHRVTVETLLGRRLNPTEADVCRGFWDIGWTPQDAVNALGGEHV